MSEREFRFRLLAVLAGLVVVVVAMVLGDLGPDGRARLATGYLSFVTIVAPTRRAPVAPQSTQMEMTYTDDPPSSSSRRPPPPPTLLDRVLTGCSLYFVSDLIAGVV